MIVRVRMFAALKQAAGSGLVELELPDGATVGQLRRRLAERLPQAGNLIERVMFAVDAKYADENLPVAPDADVACIPPVSGG